MIDTVLISARLESDKSALIHSKVNLSELLNTCFNRVKDRFSELRTFEFQNLSADMENAFFIWGNPYHLTMLFDNLLDNAVKYTEKGGMIQAGVLLKKDFIQVFIKDNGVGIEKNHLKKYSRNFIELNEI